nr:hypothetical protein EDBMFHNC_05191 [Klebsiella pneumoniae]QOQ33086.1 hypothetical protein BOPHEOLJ_05142 [Klebsiella pneumoniae]
MVKHFPVLLQESWQKKQVSTGRYEATFSEKH